MATQTREGPGCSAWLELQREKLAARLKAPGSRFGQREGDWEWRQTCWHLSASLVGGGEEKPGRSNTKEPRCTSGRYLDFTILKTSLLFKTQPNALKDVGWLFPYTAVPILGWRGLLSSTFVV